jgi:hypothetical protein
VAFGPVAVEPPLSPPVLEVVPCVGEPLGAGVADDTGVPASAFVTSGDGARVGAGDGDGRE